MERSGMWGLRNGNGNGVLQGRPIPAPHGAGRNVGLRDGSGKRVLKERPNIYCIVNHHLQFISSLQDFLPASSA
ncbi:hypothetical protein Barb4_02848 [Bacteroidales bacterium Barb4]|nr:hypothetical protein Barb4_02848 [Bacteroidales bacterium Barb4]